MLAIERFQLVLAVAGLAWGCEGATSTSAEGHAPLLAAERQAPESSPTGERSAQPLAAILGRGDAGFITQFLGSQMIGNSQILQADGRVDIGVPLHVRSNFAGGGPTVQVDNADAGGDVALDFLSAGELIGNVGVIRSGPIDRFFILQNNPNNLPLALAENGGNVGIGTANPAGPLHVRTPGQALILETTFGAMVFDFYANGEFFGNLGLLREPPDRFFILQNNPRNLPLALAENGGNVGIGTADPKKTLDVNGDGHFSGNVIVAGDLAVTGTKSSVATLGDGRRVLLYAIESPQNWFEDFGTAQLEGGEAWVSLEGVFAETVNTGGTYHVFLTPNGNCNGLYVAEKRSAGFLVREVGGGRSSVAFDYRIVATRRGFEKVRLQGLP